MRAEKARARRAPRRGRHGCGEAEAGTRAGARRLGVRGHFLEVGWFSLGPRVEWLFEDDRVVRAGRGMLFVAVFAVHACALWAPRPIDYTIQAQTADCDGARCYEATVHYEMELADGLAKCGQIGLDCDGGNCAGEIDFETRTFHAACIPFEGGLSVIGTVLKRSLNGEDANQVLARFLNAFQAQLGDPPFHHAGQAVAVGGSSGEIHVKGYYRKDGTYVRPHTRRRSK